MLRGGHRRKFNSVGANPVIGPLTIFSTFHMNQLAKIHGHPRKSVLTAKFKSARLETN